MRFRRVLTLLIFILFIILNSCTNASFLSSEKDLYDFMFGATINGLATPVQKADISNSNYNEFIMPLPDGTDLSSLKASFYYQGIKVEVNGRTQVSGVTPNDFTNTVTYTVIAENGSTTDYYINAITIGVDEKIINFYSLTESLNSFSLYDNIIFNIDEGSKIISNPSNVPYGANLNNIIATFDKRSELILVNGIYQISGSTANNLSNGLTYEVIAWNGTTSTYNLTINKETVEIDPYTEATYDTSIWGYNYNYNDLVLIKINTYSGVYPGVYSYNRGDSTGASGSDVTTVHEVQFSKDFYAGKYEITYDLWQKVVDYWGATYTFTAGAGQNGQSGAGLNEPVVQVSWADAVVWCNAYTAYLNSVFTLTLSAVYYTDAGLTTLCTDATVDSGVAGFPIYVNPSATGYRLLTEAEWEYLARNRSIYDGKDISGALDTEVTGTYAWYLSNSSSDTHAVGTRNSNNLQMYDMSGNVRELVHDSYLNYTTGTLTDPMDTSDLVVNNKVVRGGSYSDDINGIRNAKRYQITRDYKSDNLGFRIGRYQ